MTGETWTPASDTTETWIAPDYYVFPPGYVDAGYVTPNGYFSGVWASPTDTNETWT